MWKVRWKLSSGNFGFVDGLKSLRECKARLRDVRDEAEVAGESLVAAYAHPTISGGKIVLATADIGVQQHVGIGR